MDDLDKGRVVVLSPLLDLQGGGSDAERGREKNRARVYLTRRDGDLKEARVLRARLGVDRARIIAEHVRDIAWVRRSHDDPRRLRLADFNVPVEHG